MLNLRPNCIVSPAEQSYLLEKPVRVLGIDKNYVLVIELGRNPTKPWKLAKSILLQEIDSGAAVVSPELVPMYLLRTDEELSENERNSRDRNWNLVRGLVEDQSALTLLSSSFGKLVAEHAMMTPT